MNADRLDLRPGVCFDPTASQTADERPADVLERWTCFEGYDNR
jgi:hypothetical protein